ncbi:MAG: hypothetical protein ACPL7K_09155 [Armatimonadota bacterium]|jgi:hypothetical protein
MAWSIEERIEYNGRLFGLWRHLDAEGRPKWVIGEYDNHARCWREPLPGAGYYTRKTALKAAGLPFCTSLKRDVGPQNGRTNTQTD